MEDRGSSLVPPDERDTEPNGEQRPMGELEAQQTFEAALVLAQEGTEPDDVIAARVADLLREMQDSPLFPHYFEKLNPGAYNAETKQLSEKARQRLNLALEKFSESLGSDKSAA